jgi:DNA-binding response OmpR family regulator
MSDPTTDARVALVLEPDLFFAVKIRDTLARAGWQVIVASKASAFAGRLGQSPKPAIAIVAIGASGEDWRSAIASASAEQVPVLAFGSHVDTEAHSVARQAGATRVIANSRLAGDIVAQVEQTIARTARAMIDPTSEEN